MGQPSNNFRLPRWGSDAGTESKPPLGKRQEGWRNGETPSPREFNWIFRRGYETMKDAHFHFFRAAIKNYTEIGTVTDDLYDVLWSDSDGLFVAVGDSGAIWTSPDGNTWTSRTSGTGSNLYGIAYDGTNYVAVGAGGVFTESTDAITWSASTMAGANNYRDVTWNGWRFIAVGDGGNIETYSGSGSWSAVTSGTTEDLKAIAVTDSPAHSWVVAVGANGDVRSSEEAATSWTAITAAGGYTGTFYGVAYGDERFVLSGDSEEIQYGDRNTGITELTAADTSGLSSGNERVNYVLNTFFRHGSGTSGIFEVSRDGITWEETDIAPTGEIRRVTSSDRVIVGAGAGNASGDGVIRSLYF